MRAATRAIPAVCSLVRRVRALPFGSRAVVGISLAGTRNGSSVSVQINSSPFPSTISAAARISAVPNPMA